MTSQPSTPTNRRLVVTAPTTIRSIPAWGEHPALVIDPPADLKPGVVYRLLIDPEASSAQIVTIAYAWQTPYGTGPVHETQDDAENSDRRDAGETLLKLYITPDGRIVHTEEVQP